MLDWYIYLAGGGALAVVLFLMGTPIFLSFLTIILIGIGVIIGPYGYPLLVNSVYEATTTTSLASIPLFILMGELLFRSGTMDVLFTSVDRLVGKVKGRQYVLIVILSAVFGALSGSGLAVTSMLGRAAIPIIIRRGYDVNLALGCILGGASMAPIIPPSILAIIIGTLADVSIARLLISGVVPGMVLTTLFLGYIFIAVKLDPSKSPPPDLEVSEVTGREKLIALARCMPFMIIIFMVMGLIMLGIATPSESAATGVIGAIITAAIYRNLSWKMIIQSLTSAVAIAATILIIMAMSKMLTQLLAFTGSTRALVDLITGLGLPELPMLLVMLAVPFILCMFVDQIAIMLILIPLFEPIMQTFGFDPVWFWLLFLINMTLGGMTPPLGYDLFALKSVTPGIPLQQIYKAVWPFVMLYILGMAILVAFPGLVTFLPSLL